MATLIRDALEAVLLAGVKVWGLEVSDDQVRDGVRCFQDDEEVLDAAEALDVPGDVLSILPGFLEQHPGILEREEVHRAFGEANHERIDFMIEEVSEALGILKPLLRDEVEPDYFGIVFGTLAFLTMESFCPEVWQVSQMLGLLEENTGHAITRYANAIVTGGWPMARRIRAQIIATELGQVIDRIIHRQSRRTFTLLAFGDRPALAIVLVQIMKEVNYADNRTDSSGHEEHEEETQ